MFGTNTGLGEFTADMDRVRNIDCEADGATPFGELELFQNDVADKLIGINALR
jgi:hypothetical protein